jgi:hypothetical protein
VHHKETCASAIQCRGALKQNIKGDKEMKYLPIIAAALSFASAAHASTPHPQMYSFLVQAAAYDADAREYFNCDYTTKACERGIAFKGVIGRWRVFEMIADADRKTVIGHAACMDQEYEHACWNFTTGTVVQVIASPNPLNRRTKTGDIPPDRCSWPFQASTYGMNITCKTEFPENHSSD